MEILLIRHGDPDYANDSLTPRGVVEAQRLAEALTDVDIDDASAMVTNWQATGMQWGDGDMDGDGDVDLEDFAGFQQEFAGS